MKTETCACQVGRELRSTSSQAVLSHTSPALDSPARPRRPIDRPHGRSRLQADAPSNSSTSRGWWADSRAHLADSLSHLAHPRAHLARFRAHLCLVRQRRKWLCIGQSAIAHIGQRLRSPHMPGRVSVCILYAYLTKDVPCSLYDSDDSKTKRNFCEACGVRRLQVYG